MTRPRRALGRLHLASIRAANSTPLRFLLAGAVNTAFGLSIYPLLLWCAPVLRVHYLIGLGIAQVISILFAYISYKVSVFRTRANVMREFGAFGSFYLVVSAINWLVLPLLVEFVHLPPIVAQLGFSLVLMVVSYFWHSRITFKSARES